MNRCLVYEKFSKEHRDQPTPTDLGWEAHWIEFLTTEFFKIERLCSNRNKMSESWVAMAAAVVAQAAKQDPCQELTRVLEKSLELAKA